MQILNYSQTRGPVLHKDAYSMIDYLSKRLKAQIDEIFKTPIDTYWYICKHTVLMKGVINLFISSIHENTQLSR